MRIDHVIDLVDILVLLRQGALFSQTAVFKRTQRRFLHNTSVFLTFRAMLIYLFSVILGVLPSFGRGEVTDIGFWSTGFLTLSGLKALILPSVTLSLFQMTYVIRLVRAEMMEILQTDYIKFAKARGIKKNIINYKHALKNGLIPVITITGINIGTLIAFSIITETVFQWPGMGSLFINAVYFVDIPIMSAYMIMVAFIFVMINFIVDITYYFIDPRIRIKEENS